MYTFSAYGVVSLKWVGHHPWWRYKQKILRRGQVIFDCTIMYVTLVAPLDGASCMNVEYRVWHHTTGAWRLHYNDVIMGAIASQITSLTFVYSIVYSTVYSDANERKHQSSASLAFVWGIHRWPVNSPHKWPVTRKNVSIWWRHYAFVHDDVKQWGNRRHI